MAETVAVPQARMTEPEGTASPRPPRRRRWRRRLAAAAALGLLLYLFRAPILTAVAGVLISEGAWDEPSAVLIVDDEGSGHVVEEAARLFAAGRASRVLLPERRPGRIERLGILEPEAVRARRALVARGVPEPAIEILPLAEPADAAWQEPRQARQWLDAHPAERVTALCDRFYGRRGAAMFRQTLNSESAGRVRWRSVAGPRFDETNWWRYRLGVLAVFNGWARLAHVTLCGEPPRRPDEWDADAYEQELRNGGRP